jgi:hypothetical protein
MIITSWSLVDGTLELNTDTGVLNFHGVDAVTYNSTGIDAEDYMRVNNEIHTKKNLSQEDFETLMQNAALRERQEQGSAPTIRLTQENFTNLLNSIVTE